MAIQHQHIIELSNRYQLTINDSGYTLYQLTLNSDGVWKRAKGKICRNFETVIETLKHCELNNEDVQALKDCTKVLKAIHSEIKEIKALSQ